MILEKSPYENIIDYLNRYEILPDWQDVSDVITLSVSYEYGASDAWDPVFRLNIPIIGWQAKGKNETECLDKTLDHLRNHKIERRENVRATK